MLKKTTGYLLLFLIPALLLPAGCDKEGDNRKPPTIITLAVVDITTGSATSGGNITDNGGTEVFDRGLVWNTAPNPSVELHKGLSSNGSGTGVFSSPVTGLAPGTLYYLRAYATNTKGISYGNEQQFSTLSFQAPELITREIRQISFSSAISGGIIVSDGGQPVGLKGVCWSASPMPVIFDSAAVSYENNPSFELLISGLMAETTYFIRAFAINSVDTAYGNQLEFTTLAAPVPEVSTMPVNNVTHKSASGGGNITDDGGFPVISRGVCLATHPFPTLDDSFTQDGSGTGSFTSELRNLLPNTLYYIRAYANNGKGTGYGNQISFVTLSSPVPVLTTTAITDTGYYNATSGGAISDDNGFAVTARGVCWSRLPQPALNDSCTQDGIGSGSFTSYLSGLNQNTMYYVRAYATNSEGTGFGNELSFTTLRLLTPTVTTGPVTDISNYSAVCAGHVASDGGSHVSAYGLCWSTAPNPTLNDNFSVNGSGTGPFSELITGLTPGQTYYIRAYATNSLGTSYGNPLNFTTSSCGIPFTDTRDGRVYETTLIGQQCWMSRNMAWLPSVSPPAAGSGTATYYYVYNYIGTAVNQAVSTFNYQTYGVLYNYPAALNACPAAAGWRLPTDNDWADLITYLGGNSGAGGKLKTTGTVHWNSPNVGATNESGFSGLPGGHRSGSDFSDMGFYGHWWSSSPSTASNAWSRYLFHADAVSVRFSTSRENGLSVRCLKSSKE